MVQLIKLKNKMKVKIQNMFNQLSDTKKTEVINQIINYLIIDFRNKHSVSEPNIIDFK